jgi:hypothetical protein
MKQVKMQWLQDSNIGTVYNLNNARQEATRYFREKKKKISENKKF